MEKALLKAGLYFIAVAAMIIGSAISLFGIDPVGQFFSKVMSIIYDVGPLHDLGTPNDDSELRFYSVFFVAYGYILFRTAKDLSQHGHRLPPLLGLFFLGGLTRLLSFLMIGQPHALFMLLMVIELAMPPILYFLWRRANTKS